MSSIIPNVDEVQHKQKMWKDQLNKFLVDNNIVGTAAGVSIALVTKDVIQAFVGDVIIPGIIFLLLKLNIHSLTELLPGKSEFDFTDFIKEFISWIFVVVITFVFVKVAFEGLLGIDSKQTDNKSSGSGSGSGINNENSSLMSQQYMSQNNTEHFTNF